MEIQTESNASWLVFGALFLIISCALVFGLSSLSDAWRDFAPVGQAEADVLRQVGPQATATAAALQAEAVRIQNDQVQWQNQFSRGEQERIAVHAEAQRMLALSKAQAVMPAEVALLRTSYYGVAMVLAGGVVAVLVVLVAGSGRARRQALLPVSRVIAPHLFLVEDPGGTVVVDTITGYRALLRDAAGVDRVRAGVIERALIAERMAKAAERIARSTGSPNPADWLHQIADVARTNGREVV